MASTSSSSFASLSGVKSSINRAARRPDTVRFLPSQISAAYASVERPRSESISTKVGSLYDVLGIQMSASCQEIKQAYRRLARVSHPDVACSGDDDFIRINSAYATLSDPQKRADYDRTIMFVTRRSRSSEMSNATSYGYSNVYGNRRWETDQCTLAATFTVTNKCDHSVWPGILSNAGSPQLDSTGFELRPGNSRSLQVSQSWSGRIWGRTGCTFDPITLQGTCLTGDCGSNQIECNGAGAAPPATLAEFTIGSGSLQDFYDVSLVDGYNLPLIVEAAGGSGECATTGCLTDLNRQCPAELRLVTGEGCRSACEAFGSDEYCCSGEYSTPDVCKPSVYSAIFKAACPKSYSYAYDDATSTFTCSGADYTITFCPSITSKKSAAATDSPPSYSSTGSSTPSRSNNEPISFDTSWFTDMFSNGGSCSSKRLSEFLTLSGHSAAAALYIFLLL